VGVRVNKDGKLVLRTTVYCSGATAERSRRSLEMLSRYGEEISLKNEFFLDPHIPSTKSDKRMKKQFHSIGRVCFFELDAGVTLFSGRRMQLFFDRLMFG
jgi:hypothetical protein